jgi:Tol biopolymer transport system component
MFPSWSPDGAPIAFWSSRDGAGCHVMPALGGAARRVAGAGAFDPHAPVWSRGGRRVSCVTGGPGEITLTTFVVDTGEVVDQLPRCVAMAGRCSSPNRPTGAGLR